MIKLDINHEGSVIAGQQTINPSIYFDNYALMDIAYNKSMADKFIKILKGHNGTLNFSGMNLLELSLITDAKQIIDMEIFLDKVMPNLFFIEIIPQTVIDRENKIMSTGEQKPPHADTGLLEFFVKMDRSSINPLSTEGFFKDLGQKEIIEDCKGFLGSFASLVQEKRNMIKANPKYKDLVSKIPTGKQIQRVTRYIYQDIVNSVIRDSIDMSNTNNWRDLFHTIVPVAYCDLVLLDKTWAHKANEVIKRIQRGGQSAEMAKVFSIKNIKEFWNNFENFSNS